MSRLGNSFAVMFGREPVKPTPEQQTNAAKGLFRFKREPEQVQKRKRYIKEEKAHFKPGHRWRIRRWVSIILINLLFVLSYQADIQVVEGV